MALDLLDVYDTQLRGEVEVACAAALVRIGPLLCAVKPWGGFVTYQHLEGVDGATLDRLISEVIEYFRDQTQVTSFEWKSRGHDAPADLADHLLAHGLLPDPVETVMMGEAEALIVEVPLPPRVRVRRADTAEDRADLLSGACDLQAEVFGRATPLAAMTARLDAGNAQLWVAEIDRQVICAGRLEIVPGTSCAGLWGGATHPDWRGQGVYRALVAARARSARDHGVVYLHSDCTAMSRPILGRAGLVEVTTTTPFNWIR